VKRDLYAEVSERILSELQRGAVPWVKPWAATPGQNVPQNAVTSRPYSGCNVILLWLARNRGWATPRFLTFKQAQEAGGHVRKGEHGTKVYFVKQLQVKDGDGDEAESRLIPMMREYTVFNVDQCDGLPDSIRAGKPMRVRNPDTRDVLADEFLRSTGADIREGHGEAYYVPSHDFISMPAFQAFKGADHFYNVAFHELTHWTGHKSRLDRDLKNRFGGRAYAAEELVAELGAAFLSAEFGFDGDVRNAGYIATWIELLKADKRAFFTAASKASKAADYLRGLALCRACHRGSLTREHHHVTQFQPLTLQAQLAYDAAINSPSPDWRAVAELFRAAMRASPTRASKPKAPAIADYNVDRIKLKCRSPRIAARFMDGEAVFTHVPSAPGRPLNIGRALRVAIMMYRSRRTVRQRYGFREYDRAMPVPEIFQVRCLETDELFDVDICNAHTARERASNDPQCAKPMRHAMEESGIIGSRPA
jgi:antirestriction protein ArdC